MGKNPDYGHNSDEIFEDLLRQAKENRKETNSTNFLMSDEQVTNNQPEDEKERSRAISTILHHYEYSYKNKVDFQRKYRKILFWGCSLIILAFAGAILWVLHYGICNIDSANISGVATVITATLSLVVSIMGLIKIITKYCFPKNDEEYIARIVESIQKNDLARIKEQNRSAEVRSSQHQRNGNPED